MRNRFQFVVLSSILLVWIVGCGGNPSVINFQSKAIDAEGLHNVFQLSPDLFSGSSPEGKIGFQSLQKLGIKTIISVDGAQPELDLAKPLGFRYVHLPIGYDGASREQILRITKAVRDLPGPIYLHCHHGKHRAPAATAAVRICLNEKCTIQEVIDQMKQSGTDPRYVGLYALPQSIQRPTKEELDQLPSDFPEIAKVSAIAEIMIAIDHRWENLLLIQKADWKQPVNHPDLDPPHEALQLLEHYREMARLPQVMDFPESFHNLVKEAEKQANQLEKRLRESNTPDAIETVFRQCKASCTECHVNYRDVPKNR
jgi:protein tyrosine phosphatase (PTP) superfamily phosphohydrolase (DUF442 family)